jgi:platelet-activating factor acetylhydrolase
MSPFETQEHVKADWNVFISCTPFDNRRCHGNASSHSIPPYSVSIDFCSAELHIHIFNQTSGLVPWRSSIPLPLLVINAEEHTIGGGFRLFTDQVAGTATSFPTNPLVFSIPGATHPSFSDVFLILPEYVNKLTGLGVRAERVLQLIVDATLDFIAGDTEKIVSRATEYVPSALGETLPVRDMQGSGEQTVGEVAKPARPLGLPGELIWHRFR